MRRRVVLGGTGPVTVRGPATAPSECAPVTLATRETAVAHLPVQGPRNAQVQTMEIAPLEGSVNVVPTGSETTARFLV